MADANGAYTTAEHALPTAKLLAENNFHFFEEPVVFWLYDEDEKLNSMGIIPVAAGEQEYRPFLFKYAMRTKAVTFVQPDAGYSGGFSQMLDVARYAENVGGITVEPHSPQPGMNNIVTMHLLHSTTAAADVMEFNCVDNGAPSVDIFKNYSFDLRNGSVAFPSGPGWGVELKDELWEARESYGVAALPGWEDATR